MKQTSDKELVMYALQTLKANLDEISLEDLGESELILEKRIDKLIMRIDNNE